jgi:SAM-dependent methyltransferase
MPVAFDQFSEEYAELLRDPIREKFAPGSQFFHERKWALLQSWARGSGIDLDRETWLDIGCGKGELLRLGQPHVGRALGCDLSEGMLQSCSDLEVRLQSSPERLPFEDGSVGLVTAVCVYHHVEIEGRRALTAEVYRVLRSGGFFCIIEHNPLNPVTRLIVSRTPVDADAILLSAASTRKLMTTERFELVGTRYFLYFPEAFYRRLGKAEDWLEQVPLGGQYAVLSKKVA